MQTIKLTKNKLQKLKKSELIDYILVNEMLENSEVTQVLYGNKKRTVYCLRYDNNVPRWKIIWMLVKYCFKIVR